jgi:hypothetical protein
MEPSQPPQNRATATTVTLCTAATSSLAGVYLLTASIPATVIAAVVVFGLSAAHLVVHR